MITTDKSRERNPLRHGMFECQLLLRVRRDAKRKMKEQQALNQQPVGPIVGVKNKNNNKTKGERHVQGRPDATARTKESIIQALRGIYASTVGLIVFGEGPG